MTHEVQTRLLEQDVAVFLHQRLHKSQKILMCKSDMTMAKEIVALVEGTREAKHEDNERPRVSSR